MQRPGTSKPQTKCSRKKTSNVGKEPQNSRPGTLAANSATSSYFATSNQQIVQQAAPPGGDNLSYEPTNAVLIAAPPISQRQQTIQQAFAQSSGIASRHPNHGQGYSSAYPVSHPQTQLAIRSQLVSTANSTSQECSQHKSTPTSTSSLLSNYMNALAKRPTMPNAAVKASLQPNSSRDTKSKRGITFMGRKFRERDREHNLSISSGKKKARFGAHMAKRSQAAATATAASSVCIPEESPFARSRAKIKANATSRTTHRKNLDLAHFKFGELSDFCMSLAF